MQDYSLSAIEDMLRANAIKVTSEELLQKRKAYQASAMTELTLLGYMADLASGQKCILARQHEHITKLLYDCRLMLGSWTRSDSARFEQSKKAKAQNASFGQLAIDSSAPVSKAQNSAHSSDANRNPISEGASAGQNVRVERGESSEVSEIQRYVETLRATTNENPSRRNMAEVREKSLEQAEETVLANSFESADSFNETLPLDNEEKSDGAKESADGGCAALESAPEGNEPKPQETGSYPSRKGYKPKYVKTYAKKNSEAQNSAQNFEQLAIWDGE